MLRLLLVLRIVLVLRLVSVLVLRLVLMLRLLLVLRIVLVLRLVSVLVLRLVLMLRLLLVLRIVLVLRLVSVLVLRLVLMLRLLLVLRIVLALRLVSVLVLRLRFGLVFRLVNVAPPCYIMLYHFSLFKVLTNRGGEGLVELCIQYRMCRDIMAIPNHLTYNNRLACGSKAVAEAVLPVADTGSLSGFINKCVSGSLFVIHPCTF